MYHAIPSEWGAAGVRCHRPLSTSDDFVVALASDAADPVPIFAAINSTVSNTRRRALDVVAFVGPACELGLPTRAGELDGTEPPSRETAVSFATRMAPANIISAFERLRATSFESRARAGSGVS